MGVPNPDAPDRIIESEVLESQPMLVQKLVDEQFRAVHVAAGDSISIALSAEGQLRAWGSFRVSKEPLFRSYKPGSSHAANLSRHPMGNWDSICQPKSRHLS